MLSEGVAVDDRDVRLIEVDDDRDGDGEPRLLDSVFFDGDELTDRIALCENDGVGVIDSWRDSDVELEVDCDEDNVAEMETDVETLGDNDVLLDGVTVDVIEELAAWVLEGVLEGEPREKDIVKDSDDDRVLRELPVGGGDTLNEMALLDENVGDVDAREVDPVTELDALTDVV